MSSFKSPELIVNGKIVKVIDTSNNEVNHYLFSNPASTSKPGF